MVDHLTSFDAVVCLEWKVSLILGDSTSELMVALRRVVMGLCCPANIYLIKVFRYTRTRCEICPKLTIKTPEQRPKLVMSLQVTFGSNRNKMRSDQHRMSDAIFSSVA